MRTLLPEEILSRRLGDAAELREIHESKYPVSIRGFHSATDAMTGVHEIPLADETDPPSVFTLTCEFATLDAQHRPLHGATFLIDPNAGGDYPVSEPVARIISKPVPFAPHIGLPSGAVCHGHFVWTPLRTPLSLYVAQLCRLLNYDEPAPDQSFSALNAAAVRHWATLGHQPLDPELGSPTASGLDSRTRVARPAAATAKRTMRRTDASTASGSRRRMRRAS